MKSIVKKIGPHVIVIVLFLLLDALYFSPVAFENKSLPQGDVQSAAGWGQDLRDYHQKTGEWDRWSNRMFGGMPHNYTYMEKEKNIFRPIAKVMQLGLQGSTMNVMFLYLLGFYFALIAMGYRRWLSFFGAIAFAFVSYNIVIIAAGHISKGLVMAMMAPALAGVILIYKRNYLLGSLMTLLSVGLSVYFTHQQISYYMLLMFFLVAVVYFIYALKEKTVAGFFKSSALLLLLAGLAVGPALGHLIPKADYAKDSMRGGAVLTQHKDQSKEHTGLDIDYAYQWSYGVGETMTLLIPDFYGGSSNYDLGEDSEFYRTLDEKAGRTQAIQYASQAPTYWGKQPFTSGPVYAGAIVCLLFVLGFFIVDKKNKWWLLLTALLGVVLSWGKNFPLLNDFLFYHLPLYNKFRTPSMSLVLTNFAMVWMSVLTLKTMIKAKDRSVFIKPLVISLSIVGGLSLFFALFGGMLFDFSASSDTNFPAWLRASLLHDRAQMLRHDAFRSLGYIFLGGVTVWALITKKIKPHYGLILLTLFTLVDLWSVDKRFLNNDDFTSKRSVENHVASPAVKQIMLDPDPDFRVWNGATNTFNESHTSYFVNTIGGYSPVKLRRTQDIIDFYLSGQPNQNILNMMNTKYFLMRTKQGEQVMRNPEAYGHAWFVDQVKLCATPDEEIRALGQINLKEEATVEKIWEKDLVGVSLQTSDAVASEAKGTIELKDYVSPGHLVYTSSNALTKLAVFPEVYYKTWQATIDGKAAKVLRVNYNYRGLVVPSGQHTITFRCVDTVFDRASKWSLIFSIIDGLIILLLIVLLVRQYKQTSCKEEELKEVIQDEPRHSTKKRVVKRQTKK